MTPCLNLTTIASIRLALDVFPYPATWSRTKAAFLFTAWRRVAQVAIAQVVSCEACNPDADWPFQAILDRVIQGVTDYYKEGWLPLGALGPVSIPLIDLPNGAVNPFPDIIAGDDAASKNHD